MLLMPVLPSLYVQAPAVTLFAAAVHESGKLTAEIRLRWRVSSGWIPSGGFRVYRISTNPTVRTAVADVAAPSHDKLVRFMPPTVQVPDIPSLLASGKPVELAPKALSSSLDLYLQRKDLSSQLFSMEGPLNKVQRQTVLSQLRLRRPDTTKFQLGGQTKMAADELARRSVHFAASIADSYAQQVGLGATDHGVRETGNVGYELVGLANGKETGTLASLPNTSVQSLLQPPAAPSGVLFSQVNDEIGLRWNTPTGAEATRLLAVSYRVQKQTAGSGNPIDIARKPIVVVGQATDTEPLNFVTDRLAKPVQVTYTVLAVDGFGRASEPSTITVTPIDWRRPTTPVAVGATSEFRLAMRQSLPKVTLGGFRAEAPPLTLFVSTAPVTVLWMASQPIDGTAPKYIVFRTDLDAPAGTLPVQLTPAPIDGSTVSVDSDTEMDRAVQVLFRNRLIDLNAALSQAATPEAKRAAAIRIARLKVDAQVQLKVKAPLKFADQAGLDHRYVYAVASIMPSGRESDEISTGKVDVPTPQAPSAVGAVTTGFRASNNTGIQLLGAKPIGGLVDLAWAPAATLGVRYEIARKFGDAPFQTVTRIEASRMVVNNGLQSYSDAVPLSRARAYDYRITPISRWNIRAVPTLVSVSVPATVPPQPPVLASVRPGEDGQLVVTWFLNPPEDQAGMYAVFRDGAEVGRVQGKPGPIDPTAKTLSFKDSSLDSTPHSYTVFAIVGSAGDGAKSGASNVIQSAAQVTKVAAPSGLTAVMSSDGIHLSWTGPAGATGYVVRRRTILGASPAKAVDFSVNSISAAFVDSTALAGVSYIYEVIALDASQNVSVVAAVTFQGQP